MFATLDPTTRNLELKSGQQIMLTDTVGFIRKLPHHLVNAFRSTLEEAKYADMIIHMVDASNPQMEQQMCVVYDTLNQLDIHDKTIITAFNKMDVVREQGQDTVLKDFRADYTVCISAKKTEGLDELLNVIEEILKARKVLIEKVFDYKEAGNIAQIRKYGQLLEERYQEDGIYIRAYVPRDTCARLKL